MVQVGFSTNYARLLDSRPDDLSPLAGLDLVQRKVRLLVAMAGAFPPTMAEYNVKVDLPATRKLFSQWPTPVAASIEKDYGYVAHHPIADAYRAYKPMPYDRPTWDLTAVLYAARPDRGYFGLSPPGRIHVDEQALTRFTPEKEGPHRYLTVTEEQRIRIREALVQLASQPPPQ
jgi:hypothetical protein